MWLAIYALVATLLAITILAIVAMVPIEQYADCWTSDLQVHGTNRGSFVVNKILSQNNANPAVGALISEAGPITVDGTVKISITDVSPLPGGKGGPDSFGNYWDYLEVKFTPDDVVLKPYSNINVSNCTSNVPQTPAPEKKKATVQQVRQLPTNNLAKKNVRAKVANVDTSSPKRRLLVVGDRASKTSYNVKFLFYDILHKEMKNPFGFTEVRIEYSGAKDDGTPPDHAIPEYLNWLSKDLKSGDVIFLFVFAHGMYWDAGDFKTKDMHAFCKNLPAGVTFFYETGACGVACTAKLQFPFKYDRLSKSLVPYDCTCNIQDSRCAWPGVITNQESNKPDPTPILAKCITISEHVYGITGAFDYNNWEIKYKSQYTQNNRKTGGTMTLMNYIYERLSDLKDVTVRQFVLNYGMYRLSNPDFVPVVCVTDPTLLDQKLPLLYSGIAKNYPTIFTIAQSLRDPGDIL
jgi:hypothetical protein